MESVVSVVNVFPIECIVYSRWRKAARTLSNSHANFRYLTTPQKKKRMMSLRAHLLNVELKENRSIC